MKQGELIVCETATAIVNHIRMLSERGPKFTGGIDTPLLCGLKYHTGWDTRIPLESLRHGSGNCMRCLGRYLGYVPLRVNALEPPAQHAAIRRIASMMGWPEASCLTFAAGHYELTHSGAKYRLPYAEDDNLGTEDVVVVVPEYSRRGPFRSGGAKLNASGCLVADDAAGIT